MRSSELHYKPPIRPRFVRISPRYAPQCMTHDHVYLQTVHDKARSAGRDCFLPMQLAETSCDCMRAAFSGAGKSQARTFSKPLVCALRTSASEKKKAELLFLPCQNCIKLGLRRKRAFCTFVPLNGPKHCKLECILCLLDLFVDELSLHPK